MKNKQSYYLDGDFDSIVEKGAVKYKAVGQERNNSAIVIELSSTQKQTINHQAFSEIVNFYNTNEKSFKSFENNLGIDVWFLQNLRLYYNYRDLLLDSALMGAFLDQVEDGIIITSNSLLLDFVDSSKIKVVPAKKVKKRKYKRFLAEIWLIVKQRSIRKQRISKTVILSNALDNPNGESKRFGSLEDSYDKIINRSLLETSNDLPKRANYSNQFINTDQLFKSYLKRFTFISDYLKIKKAYKKLRRGILSTDNKLDTNQNVILNLFWNSRKSSYLYYLRYKSFSLFFRNHQIKAVLLSDENGSQQKVVQYAAKKNKVKIAAFQHGAIARRFQLDYDFSKYNSKPLLPDVTFVWGEKYAEILVDLGYPEGTINTCGRITPNKDSLPANSKFDEIENEIILYATQPQPDQTLRVQQLKDVLLAAKEFRNQYSLVIRPHPGEKDDNYFLNIAKEVKCENFLIDRVTALELQMEKCELLITSYSTVGSEFIPFFKPLIVLDYLAEDMAGWIREGVGIPIANKNELVEILKKEERPINNTMYEVFIKNYFYRIDGDAAIRAQEVIEKLIDKWE
tara:strand:+ start:24270 stop:25976 length:1707 start_codon:yes stop_codon:yes gene_type:complete